MPEIKIKGRPDKERLLSVFKGSIPDRIPCFEVLIESKHVEKMLGKKCGDTLGKGGETIRPGCSGG